MITPPRPSLPPRSSLVSGTDNPSPVVHSPAVAGGGFGASERQTIEKKWGEAWSIGGSTGGVKDRSIAVTNMPSTVNIEDEGRDQNDRKDINADNNINHNINNIAVHPSPLRHAPRPQAPNIPPSIDSAIAPPSFTASTATATSPTTTAKASLANPVTTQPNVPHKAAAGIDDEKIINQKETEERQAAQAFEAIFIRQMIANMRATSLGDDLLGNSGLEQFQERFDAHLADQMAEQSPLGVAELLLQQWRKPS